LRPSETAIVIAPPELACLKHVIAWLVAHEAKRSGMPATVLQELSDAVTTGLREDFAGDAAASAHAAAQLDDFVARALAKATDPVR
jgi:hypothetical protein